MYQGEITEGSAASYADVEAVATPARGTLVGGALWLLSSNIGYAACQWATLAALAKLGSAAALGYFGLALAVATPVVLVTGFALRAVQATDVRRRYAFADYLNLRLAANVVAGAIIAGAAFGVVGPEAAAVLLPIGAAKLAEATSETCYGLAQRDDRMRFVALSKLTRGALGLAALVIVVALGGSVAEGAWALAVTWIAFLLLIDMRVAARFERAFAWSPPAKLWLLARESAPLGAVNGVLAAMQAVPRYLLQLSYGPAAVGYFTALAAVGPALDQVAGSIGNAAAPRLGWAANGDHHRYRRLVGRLLLAAVAMSGALATGAMFAGPQFLRLAYRPDYAAFRTAFVLLVIGGGFTIIHSVSYVALIAARRPYTQLGIQCLGLVVTAVSGLYLVPTHGVDGAAASIVVGGGAMAAVAAWSLLRRPSEVQ